jgi:hypothetical protein
MTSYSKFWFFLIKILKNSLKKVRKGHNCGYMQARELHLASLCAYFSSQYDLIFKIKNFWNFLINFKNSLKKSVMAITLDKHMLKSSNWYHFVLIGVCQMILYSKLRNFEISDIFKFAIFHNYSLPKFYSFLGRYEESFYAPLFSTKKPVKPPSKGRKLKFGRNYCFGLCWQSS